MSSSNSCFLTCIHISQEADKVVWYSYHLKNFPQFVVIHNKGFDIDNKAEIAGVQLQQPGIQPEGVRGVSEKLRQPLSFLGLPVYFKLMLFFYTFKKPLGQRFDIFNSH